jgi:molecular chaperone DnaK
MNPLELIHADARQLDYTLEQPVRAIGIDLGTTNSTVAEIIYDPDSPLLPEIRCLAVEQETDGRSWWSPLVPSVVALHDGRKLVGEGARKLRPLFRRDGLIDKGNFFSSCKDDMGLKLTYQMAPDGYRSAAEVSGHILEYLYQATLKDKPIDSDSFTVTVPASFQTAQRDDTLKAAKLADINLGGGDLLDEPIAALINYLHEKAEHTLIPPGETKNMLVFDFGGGTCDVAILKLTSDEDTEQLSAALVSVSRYHRLGGNDIDKAILYDILLPQIIKQNNLTRSSLDYEMKKQIIEPGFIGIAEQLKIAVCEQIDKFIGGDWDDTDEDDEPACVIHGKSVCKQPDSSSLTLTNPSLGFNQFNDLMEPFLDEGLLFVKETEYRQTLSIFAPIRDAMDKSGLDDNDIDFCLLVGGSCLIPLVPDKISSYFPLAEVLTFDNADEMQTAVARGAALNSLSLALYNCPIIQPVCQETISLITANGPYNLISRGTPLPWPPTGGFEELTTLALPQDSLLEPVTMRVEVVACEALGQRQLMSNLWEIPAPVVAGERIRLAYRYDENQVLEVRLSHAERDDVRPFHATREHPLTHIVNPQSVKLRIAETEEKLRTGEIRPERREQAIKSIASDCAELRQYEKAIANLQGLLRIKNEPDSEIINLMALYTGYMGNLDREEKLYQEAIKVDPKWSTPWFNLALLLQKEQRMAEAKDAIEKAIHLEPKSAPYYVLQAQIIDKLGKKFAVKEFLDMAVKLFKPLDKLSKWELHWYQKCADMVGEKEVIVQAAAERKRRDTVGEPDTTDQQHGMLPVLAA